MKVFVRQRQQTTRQKAVSVSASPCLRVSAPGARGFTLIELIMTLTVLTVMTLGVIPLVKVSVKRQREQRLREELRQMRTAIDQFHREAIAGAMLQRSRGAAAAGGAGGGGEGGGGGGGGGGVYIDPRVRVGITDQLVFSSDNPDLYPPSLETLVSGVSVTPLPGMAGGGAGGGIVGLGDSTGKATDNTLTSTKKKVYLRGIPIDPVTGQPDWDLRSTYDTPDSSSWGGENVFDVRSKSTGTALDGTKYNEW